MAELLGRHKSWVCRRLALIEKLSEPAKEELKVGLLSPTCARQLVRLPVGFETTGKIMDGLGPRAERMTSTRRRFRSALSAGQTAREP